MSASQFDSTAQAYAVSGDELPYREHLELHSLRTAVGEVTHLSVLDLGCGTGRYAQLLARWGAAHVTGVDAAAGMLDRARAIEAAEPLGIDYRLADFSTDHLDDLARTMDLVLSCYVLPYADTFPALAGMFATARTVLRPGGRFIAATLNPDYAAEPGYYDRHQFRLTAQRHPLIDGTPVHLHAWFTLESIESIDVEAYWWSTSAYERAARDGGFSEVIWRPYAVSPAGVARHGQDYWASYLARPHAVVLEAS